MKIPLRIRIRFDQPMPFAFIGFKIPQIPHSSDANLGFG